MPQINEFIEIRPVQPIDYLAWVVMVMDYNPELYDQLKSSWEKFFKENARVFGYVATIKQQPVGFMHFTYHDFVFGKAPVIYLSDLYVVPQARRHGVARRFLEWLLDHAKTEEAGRVYWVTEPGNPARILYDQYGISEYIRYHVDLIEGM